MLTRLDPVGADRAALVALLTENMWPFHVRHHLTRQQAEEGVDDGAWGDEDHRTFWIDHEVHGRVGVVRLEDLADPPLRCSTCAWLRRSAVGGSA